jgi:hypothetical protein
MAASLHHLSRRTFLRGVGASLALPLLEASDPSPAASSAAPRSPLRLGFFYVPNGVVMPKWRPAQVGPLDALTGILAPLNAVRSQVTVLSNLNGEPCCGIGAGHEPTGGGFLVGAKCTRSEEPEVAGVSVDQWAAQRIGADTPVDALTLGVETGILGDHGYSGTYLSHISWRSRTAPAPLEVDPKQLFDRLFRNRLPLTKPSGPPSHPATDSVEGSILDLVADDARALRHHLGASDRDRMDDYLEGVRSIERRIVASDTPNAPHAGEMDVVPVAPVFPAGAPLSYTERVNLLLDILVMAFQTDTTRVASFMFGAEKSMIAYPWIGAPGAHHSSSHHDNQPERIAELTAINTFHVSLFARMLQRMRDTRDGNGSLLDHVLLVYGSGISDGGWHNHDHLPILLAGGAGGSLVGGRHVDCGARTPLCNVYVEMLTRAGIDVDHFGDSTGTVPGLS